MNLDEAILTVVAEAVQQSLAPYLRRLADPEPLVYSVREAVHVLRTSTNTVRRLIDEGILPNVPHMGQRLLVPRTEVVRVVEASSGLEDDGSDASRLPPRIPSPRRPPVPFNPWSSTTTGMRVKRVGLVSWKRVRQTHSRARCHSAPSISSGQIRSCRDHRCVQDRVLACW